MNLAIRVWLSPVPLWLPWRIWYKLTATRPQKIEQNIRCVYFLKCTAYLFINSSPPSAAYMRQWIWSALVQVLAAYSAPSHYLNQCLDIVNWTLGNKLQWNFNQNKKLSIHKNGSENIVILSSGKWVKEPLHFWDKIISSVFILGCTAFLTHWGHFADDIFKCIFINENVWIPIKISLKFVPRGPINNIPALVQIMAWRRPDDKPLSKAMMVSLQTHICFTGPQWFKDYCTSDRICKWHCLPNQETVSSCVASFSKIRID